MTRTAIILRPKAVAALRGLIEATVMHHNNFASWFWWIPEPTATGWAKHLGTPCPATRGLEGHVEARGWSDGEHFAPLPCHWCGGILAPAEEPEKHKQRVNEENARKRSMLERQLAAIPPGRFEDTA
jgi:hypothetical protein